MPRTWPVFVEDNHLLGAMTTQKRGLALCALRVTNSFSHHQFSYTTGCSPGCLEANFCCFSSSPRQKSARNHSSSLGQDLQIGYYTCSPEKSNPVPHYPLSAPSLAVTEPQGKEETEEERRGLRKVASTSTPHPPTRFGSSLSPSHYGPQERSLRKGKTQTWKKSPGAAKPVQVEGLQEERKMNFQGIKANSAT